MGKRRRFSLGPQEPKRTAFVTATAIGFHSTAFASTNTSHAKRRGRTSDVPSSAQPKKTISGFVSPPFIANKSHDQSLLLPDCVSVMTLEGEESGSCSLQDDVTRLYYMLAVGCRSAASKESAAIRAVVVVLEDGSDESAVDLARLLKALTMPAFHIHSRTSTETAAVHLRELFRPSSQVSTRESFRSDSSDDKPRVLVVTSSALQIVRNSKHLRGCFAVLPVDATVMPSRATSSSCSTLATVRALEHRAVRLLTTPNWKVVPTTLLLLGQRGRKNANCKEWPTASGATLEPSRVVISAPAAGACRRRIAAARRILGGQSEARPALQRSLDVVLEMTRVEMEGRFQGRKGAGKGCDGTGTGGVAETRQKMELLRMLSSSVASPGLRVAAETKYIDGMPGERVGGCWCGSLRRGASSDAVSRAVRRIHELRVIEEQQPHSSSSSSQQNGSNSLWKPPLGRRDALEFPEADQHAGATVGWWPSPAGAEATEEANDESDDGSGDGVKVPRESREWGGTWGKACGHNEVVMHVMRPFAPLEVVNTRVCSFVDPAPGNGGYHGCLEFLRLQCRRHRRAQTCWDSRTLHWIGPNGDHKRHSLSKSELLHWSLPRLRVHLDPLRRFTVDCGGSQPPRILLRLIGVLLVLGATRASIGFLGLRNFGPEDTIVPRKATIAIVEYCLGGSAVDWRHALSTTPQEEWVWNFCDI